MNEVAEGGNAFNTSSAEGPLVVFATGPPGTVTDTDLVLFDWSGSAVLDVMVPRISSVEPAGLPTLSSVTPADVPPLERPVSGQET